MGLIILAALLALVRICWSVVTGHPAPRLVPRWRRRPHKLAAAWRAKHLASYEAVPAPATPPMHGDAALDCQVLVVGAGPTGLMAAALLQRSGIKVRIVDKRGTPSTESRAFAVQARTVELFQSLGLADALLDCGIANTSINFHVRGRPAGRLDFDRAMAPDTPYPFILMVPQCETEGVQIADLAARGIVVERGVDVQSLLQADGRVTTRCIGPDGRAFEIASAYIVGADGAHSIVRKQLGLSFEGASYEQSFLLADCRVDWAHDHHNFRIFMNRERIGLFLPLKGQACSRVMATDLRPDASRSLEMSLDELQEAFREATQLPVTLSDPAWTTRYRTHHRGVKQYRVGRAFLAGDAAHIHSPAGGQGMNTGLQDAANLAWKLAAVLRTGADDALLDSYHDERYPVGQDLLRFTDKLFSAAAAQRGWRASARDRVARFVLRRATHLPIPHRKSFRRLSEIDIAYRAGEFVEDAGDAPESGPRAGQRAPDARVCRGTTVFDLIGGYRLSLLALSRRTLSEAEVAALHAALQRLRARADGLQAHLVARVVARRDDRVLAAETAEVFERYGLHDAQAQALYLVRPDGYVAWRCAGLDIEACARFMHRLCVRAPVVSPRLGSESPHPDTHPDPHPDPKEVRYA